MVEFSLTEIPSDYAGVVSGVASLEEQLAELKDDNRNSKEVMQEQTSNVQALSGENSGLQVQLQYIISVIIRTNYISKVN